MDSRAPSASGPPPDEERIRAALREVMDPEAGFNIVDLGLIYRVAIAAPQVDIEMTMTSPACPLGDMIIDEAREAVAPTLPPGWTVDIRLVWEPPWQPALMSEAGKKHFGWTPE